MSEQEIWKPVEGFEGFYEVSSLGRVKSLGRYVKCGPNRLRRKRTRLMNPAVGHNNYRVLILHAAEIGRRRSTAVHRLVAIAFLGEPPTADHQVNHINGDKDNNRVSNLEWVTPQENSQHAVDTGLALKGEEISTSKLTEAEVGNIRRKLMQTNYDRGILARRYGVSRGAIDKIAQGNTWKHTLPEDYEPPVRITVGEGNPQAKLTAEQVLEIRERYAAEEISQAALAEQYGVTQTCVGSIVRGQTWSHLVEQVSS